jgi:hypothetical protein
VLRALIWAGPLAGVVIGLIVGAARRCTTVGLWQGAAVGLLGPVTYGLWRFYDFTVRYNPQTGEAGLHKVRVHALNALIFIVLGLVLGLIYRRLVFPKREPAADQGAHDVPDAQTDET